jgi:lipid-A-disaccharide synthase
LADLFRRFFIKVKYVSLVNLISFSEVVPALLGDDMNVDNVKQYLNPLLSNTIERRMQLEGYTQMKNILGPAGAPDRAAKEIVNLLSRQK